IGIFRQILPILDQVSQATGINLTAISAAMSSHTSGHGSDDDVAVYVEEDVSNVLGQRALNEHGHLHWISNSSTMSLFQRPKEATTSPLHHVSPMEEDELAPRPSVNKLYFPARLIFLQVDAYFARFHFLMPVLDKLDSMCRYRYQ
ncbi:hypothetical protein BD311DRAFT_603843, partial [Dichomitus squalens]